MSQFPGITSPMQSQGQAAQPQQGGGSMFNGYSGPGSQYGNSGQQSQQGQQAQQGMQVQGQPGGLPQGTMPGSNLTPATTPENDLWRRIEELERRIMDMTSSMNSGIGTIIDDPYQAERRAKAAAGDFTHFSSFSGPGPDPRSRGGGARQTAKSAFAGKYSPGGEVSQQNRERIKAKNDAKKKAKGASSPRPSNFKSAADAHASNQSRAAANAARKPSNRIDY